MSDLTDTDFPPLEPQPFVTEEGREIERLRAELSKKVAKLARMRRQRDEAVELYTDLLRRLSVSTLPRHSFLSGDASEKEGGGA